MVKWSKASALVGGFITRTDDWRIIQAPRLLAEFLFRILTEGSSIVKLLESLSGSFRSAADDTQSSDVNMRLYHGVMGRGECKDQLLIKCLYNKYIEIRPIIWILLKKNSSCFSRLWSLSVKSNTSIKRTNDILPIQCFFNYVIYITIVLRYIEN